MITETGRSTTTMTTPATIDQWLQAPDPNSSPDDPGTNAEHLGLDTEWPSTGHDAALDDIAALIDAALDAGVLPLPAGITTVVLERAVDAHLILTGARLVAVTTTGAELTGPAMTADQYTNDEHGPTAAHTVITNTIDTLTDLAAAAGTRFATIRTTEGHTYTPWTDGWAIGFLVTTATGVRELVYLNPSSETSDQRPSVTSYHGPPDTDPAEHHTAHHIDLGTTTRSQPST